MTTASEKCQSLAHDLCEQVRRGYVQPVLDWLESPANKAVRKSVIQCPDEGDEDYKGTLLHYAVEQGSEELVTNLLRKKANPHAITLYASTPLHWAAQHGHAKIASVLIRYGADVNKIDSKGQTPVEIAKVMGYMNLHAALLKKKSQQLPEGHAASALPSPSMAALGRKPGGDATAASSKTGSSGGTTPRDESLMGTIVKPLSLPTAAPGNTTMAFASGGTQQNQRMDASMSLGSSMTGGHSVAMLTNTSQRAQLQSLQREVKELKLSLEEVEEENVRLISDVERFRDAKTVIEDKEAQLQTVEEKLVATEVERDELLVEVERLRQENDVYKANGGISADFSRQLDLMTSLAEQEERMRQTAEGERDAAEGALRDVQNESSRMREQLSALEGQLVELRQKQQQDGSSGGGVQKILTPTTQKKADVSRNATSGGAGGSTAQQLAAEDLHYQPSDLDSVQLDFATDTSSTLGLVTSEGDALSRGRSPSPGPRAASYNNAVAEEEPPVSGRSMALERAASRIAELEKDKGALLRQYTGKLEECTTKEAEVAALRSQISGLTEQLAAMKRENRRKDRAGGQSQTSSAAGRSDSSNLSEEEGGRGDDRSNRRAKELLQEVERLSRRQRELEAEVQQERERKEEMQQSVEKAVAASTISTRTLQTLQSVNHKLEEQLVDLRKQQEETEELLEDVRMERDVLKARGAQGEQAAPSPGSTGSSPNQRSIVDGMQGTTNPHADRILSAHVRILEQEMSTLAQRSLFLLAECEQRQRRLLEWCWLEWMAPLLSARKDMTSANVATSREAARAERLAGENAKLERTLADVQQAYAALKEETEQVRNLFRTREESAKEAIDNADAWKRQLTENEARHAEALERARRDTKDALARLARMEPEVKRNALLEVRLTQEIEAEKERRETSEQRQKSLEIVVGELKEKLNMWQTRCTELDKQKKDADRAAQEASTFAKKLLSAYTGVLEENDKLQREVIVSKDRHMHEDGGIEGLFTSMGAQRNQLKAEQAQLKKEMGMKLYGGAVSIGGGPKAQEAAVQAAKADEEAAIAQSVNVHDHDVPLSVHQDDPVFSRLKQRMGISDEWSRMKEQESRQTVNQLIEERKVRRELQHSLQQAQQQAKAAQVDGVARDVAFMREQELHKLDTERSAKLSEVASNQQASDAAESGKNGGSGFRRRQHSTGGDQPSPHVSAIQTVTPTPHKQRRQSASQRQQDEPEMDATQLLEQAMHKRLEHRRSIAAKYSTARVQRKEKS